MSAPRAHPDRDSPYDGIAPFYDSVHAPKDRASVAYFLECFYGREGWIADVGCGTGRILVPMLRSGHRVVALEPSRRMLSEARRRVAGLEPSARERVRWVRARLGDGGLPAELEGAFLADGTLNLLELGSWAKGFGELRRCLVAGGKLVVDALPPLQGERPAVEARRLGEVVDPETGARITKSVRIERDADEHRSRVEFTYHIADAGGEREESTVLDMNVASLPELASLLEEAGFEIVRTWGGYDRSPFSDQSGRMIVEARAGSR